MARRQKRPADQPDLTGPPPPVGEGGLEPPHPFGHRHLKPARLPIPPLARSAEGSSDLRALPVAFAASPTFEAAGAMAKGPERPRPTIDTGSARGNPGVRAPARAAGGRHLQQGLPQRPPAGGDRTPSHPRARCRSHARRQRPPGRSQQHRRLPLPCRLRAVQHLRRGAGARAGRGGPRPRPRRGLPVRRAGHRHAGARRHAQGRRFRRRRRDRRRRGRSSGLARAARRPARPTRRRHHHARPQRRLHRHAQRPACVTQPRRDPRHRRRLRGRRPRVDERHPGQRRRGQEHVLHDGDEIAIGATVMRFEAS